MVLGSCTYSASANTITVTGYTSGSPCNFDTLWTSDKAGSLQLLAPTAAALDLSLTTAVKPTDKVALKLNFIITNFSVVGTITLTGKDKDGGAQSEVIAVTGNGTLVSTLWYSSIDAAGVDCVGTFTVEVTQSQWGVVSKQASNQFAFDCKIVVGDGSTATYFTDTLKQIVFSNSYAYGSYIIDVKASATFTLGAVIDVTAKSTKNGCDILVDNTNGNRFYIMFEGGTSYLYSCSFKTKIAGGDAWLAYYPTRIWNCQLYYISTRFVANCDFYGTTFDAASSAGAILNSGSGNTYANLKFFSCGTIVRGDGSVAPFVNFYSRGHTTVAAYISVVSAYTFINPDFDTWTFGWNGVSAVQKVFRQYEFDLATDASATVTLKDVSGNTVFSVTSDAATGLIATQTVSRGYYDQAHGNTLQDYGPFTLTITKAGKMPYTQTGIVLTEKTKLLIMLRTQLSGDAVVGDVASGKKYYKDDADAQQTGILALTGDADVSDVVNGRTFYKDSLTTKKTGTYVIPILTGNANADDVVNGKTFYKDDATAKLTGTLTLTGTASETEVMMGYTFYATDPKTEKTGTLTLTGLYLVVGNLAVNLKTGKVDFVLS